jgi:hypothetical protein
LHEVNSRRQKTCVKEAGKQEAEINEDTDFQRSFKSRHSTVPFKSALHFENIYAPRLPTLILIYIRLGHGLRANDHGSNRFFQVLISNNLNSRIYVFGVFSTFYAVFFTGLAASVVHLRITIRTILLALM